MKSISRRDLLTGTAAILGSAIVPSIFGVNPIEAFAATLQTPPFSPQLAVQPVTDPRCWASLDQLFPGFRNTQYFEQLKGACFLVTNVSSKPIKSVSTNWAVDIDGNKKTKLKLHYFRPRGHRKPRMHWGLIGNKTRFTAHVPLFKVGATKLVSPYFTFNPKFYKKHGAERFEKVLSSRYRTNFPARPSDIASGRASLTMSVDAVVTNDFYVVGPDLASLGKIMRITRNAERDEGSAILKLVQSGASPSDIKTVLLRHASGTAFDITPAYDLYFRVRQRQAKVLLRRLKHARWDQFCRTLRYLNSRHRTVVHKA